MTKLVPFQATIQDDDTGAAIVSPVVTVRIGGPTGDLADLFDVDGVATVNPITGGTDGFVQFQARPGKYWIQAADGGTFSSAWYEDFMPVSGLSWETFSELASDIAADMALPSGSVVHSGDMSWVKMPAAHALFGLDPVSALPGYAPFGDVYVDHFAPNTTPGTTDMAAAFTEAFDSFSAVRLMPATYSVGSTINITAITKALLGPAHQTAIIESTHTAGDLFNFTGPGTSISDITIRDVTIRGVYGSTRTSGAHLRFEKPVVRLNLSNVRMQNYYDGLSAPEFNKTFLLGCWFSQFGIASGGKGRYSINCDRTVALSGAGAVDFHVIGCQFSGLNAASGSNASGLIAHFRSNSCDGVYLSGGTHMFYADYALLFDPDGGANVNENKIASVQASGCYFDSAFISQVKMTGNTSQSVYREFTFDNCQFRDAMGGPLVDLDAAVGRASFVGGCKFRGGVAEAIKATNTGVYELIVADSHFEDNNFNDVAGTSDIDFDGDTANFSNLIFSNVRTSGRAIRIRSNASEYDLDTINVNSHANITDPILLDSTSGYVDGVQTVTNANGTYHKYKDGRLICKRVADVDVTSTAQQAFTLPMAFVDRNEASAGYSHLTGAPNAALYRTNIPRFGATETAWFVYLASPGTSTVPGTTAEQLTLHAEGTWK